MGRDWPTRHVSGKGGLYLIFVLGEGECQTLIRVLWCIHCLQVMISKVWVDESSIETTGI